MVLNVGPSMPTTQCNDLPDDVAVLGAIVDVATERIESIEAKAERHAAAVAALNARLDRITTVMRLSCRA